MARRSLPRKVTYFEPVPPRLARNTIIESTFEVGRRFRCTMRVDCSQLDAGAVIRPVPGEWHPRMPERLDEEELSDWRTGRDAVYQLAALTIGPKPSIKRRRRARASNRRSCAPLVTFPEHLRGSSGADHMQQKAQSDQRSRFGAKGLIFVRGRLFRKGLARF